ncbi:O-Antigen ligase [Vibrio palustris]|uniref:O-Antigen ligase n=2 Tax=Vibrio palustris TaxID=1918946 RepID=A0A1R4B3R1_9VIBR|nr:O-Antigen ligase [Vibrio palustris]
MLVLLFTSVLLSVGFEDIGKNIFILFLVLSIPMLWIERHTLRKDPVLWLLGALLLAQLASWLNSLHYFPNFALEMPNLDRLAKLFSFVLIAYWLRGSKQIIPWLLMAFSAGIIIAVLADPNFHSQWIRAMNGQRVDFAIKNAQFTSMFAGVGMLIHLFGYHWIRQRFSQYQRWGMLLLNTLMLGALTWLLIVSQSRQAWLGLAVALGLLPLFLAHVYQQCRGKKLVLFYVIILLCGAAFSQSSIIEKRLNQENSVMDTIAAGDWQHIPMSSVGIRFNSWIEASKWISAHPWLGSSSAAIEEVIAQSPKFSVSLKQRFGHLHNFHIETLVAYGVLGLLLVYTLYYWLLRSLFISMRHDADLKPYMVFAYTFLAFWLVINCFETFSSRTYGVYTHNIIFGCLYTFYFASRLQTQKSGRAES